MARYPIKQLKDKNELPFFPFNTLESVLVDGTGQNLADVLNNIYTKTEINTMFATELSKFNVYPSQADLPRTARDGSVAATNENNVYIMYMYYSGAWRALTQKGDKGDPGEIGPTGPEGPEGPTGPQGVPGADGRNGRDGRDGRDGYVQYTAGDGIDITNDVIRTDIPEITIAVSQVINTNPLQVLLNQNQIDILTGGNISTVYINGGAIDPLLVGYIYLNSEINTQGLNHVNYILDYLFYDNTGVVKSYSKGLIVLDKTTSVATFSTYEFDNTPAVPENSTTGTQEANIQNEDGEVVINSENTDQGTQAQIAVRGNTISLAASNGVKVAAAPLAVDDVANKGYVDDAVGGGQTTFLGFVDDHDSNANALDITGLKKGIYTFGRIADTAKTLYLKININGEYQFKSFNIEKNYRYSKRPITLNLYQDIEDLETKSGALYDINYIVMNELEYDIKLQNFYASIYNGAFNETSSYRIIHAVGLSNSQTITGRKAFTTLPQSSQTPSDNKDFTTKKYVDDAIASAVTSALGGSY